MHADENPASPVGHLPVPGAILIDLDDTILDTTDSATRVWRETAIAFAEEIGQPVEVFEPVLEESRRWYWADPARHRAGRLDVFRSRVEVTQHGLEQLGLDDPDLSQRFAEHYTGLRVSSMRFFSGALETLEHFHAANIPMALITNGDATAQRDKVEHFDLARFFKTVLIEGELGYGKPDGRVFEAALKACGVKPEDAWCIGDNLAWEVAAPQKLGITGVWVDWRNAGLPDDTEIVPDCVVQRIAELAEAVR